MPLLDQPNSVDPSVPPAICVAVTIAEVAHRMLKDTNPDTAHKGSTVKDTVLVEPHTTTALLVPTAYPVLMTTTVHAQVLFNPDVLESDQGTSVNW